MLKFHFICYLSPGIYSVVRLNSAVSLVIKHQMFISTCNISCFCQNKQLKGPREKNRKPLPRAKVAFRVRGKCKCSTLLIKPSIHQNFSLHCWISGFSILPQSDCIEILQKKRVKSQCAIKSCRLLFLTALVWTIMSLLLGFEGFNQRSSSRLPQKWYFITLITFLWYLILENKYL